MSSWIVPLCLTLGCDVAEPDSASRELGLSPAGAGVTAELIVEVAVEGRPVIAERVFASGPDGSPVEAECIVHAGPQRCRVWSLGFAPTPETLVYAELCGQRHAEPFPIDLTHIDDDFTLRTSVTLQADGFGCVEALPQGCGGGQFAEPALSITAMDSDGIPVPVRDVVVHSTGETSSPADCMEGAGDGCSEWASVRTEPGRYQASVDVCGQTVRSEWVDVAADSFGCAMEPAEVTLVVPAGPCRYAG